MKYKKVIAMFAIAFTLSNNLYIPVNAQEEITEPEMISEISSNVSEEPEASFENQSLSTDETQAESSVTSDTTPTETPDEAPVEVPEEIPALELTDANSKLDDVVNVGVQIGSNISQTHVNIQNKKAKIRNTISTIKTVKNTLPSASVAVAGTTAAMKTQHVIRKVEAGKFALKSAFIGGEIRSDVRHMKRAFDGIEVPTVEKKQAAAKLRRNRMERTFASSLEEKIASKTDTSEEVTDINDTVTIEAAAVPLAAQAPIHHQSSDANDIDCNTIPSPVIPLASVGSLAVILAVLNKLNLIR